MQFHYKILHAGNDITARIRPLFMRLEINDTAGNKPDTLSLSLFDDGKFKFPERESVLEVWTGYHANTLHLKGKFTVEDIVLGISEPVMVIHGSGAKLRSSFKSQRDHTWHQVTLKEMITSIAQRNGFKPAVAQAFDDIEIDHIDQRGQSDADLTRQLATQYGATLKTTTDRLIFIEHGASKSAKGNVLPPIPLAANHIVKGQITLKGSPSVDGVKAWYYDTDQAKRIEVIAGDQNGKRLKQLPGDFDTPEQARAAATAEWQKLQRSEFELAIQEMPAVPQLTAERIVNITGHRRSQVNQQWVIDELTETLSEKGFVQKMKGVLPKNRR